MEDYEIEEMIPKSMTGEERRELKLSIKRKIRRKSLGAFATGTVVGLGVTFMGMGIFEILDSKNYTNIRKTDNVEEGFVIPSKLEEISVKNLDLTGKPETTLRYDGKDFLWKLDKDGRPIGVPYEIEPSKYTYTPPKIIIPK